MNLLPLLNSTNRHRLASESSSKRKCAALAHKAAPTCTLSLTSVSVSAHGSSDSLNFIPFPCTSATTPFPSEPVPIPVLTSTTITTTSVPPRARARTQASLLRRKRSSARLLLQPEVRPCSSQVESEPDHVSSTPPRKRARKASLSSPSTTTSPSSLPTSSSLSPSLLLRSSYHSLAISPHRKSGKSSKKAAVDLRFLSTVYRSVAWLRLQREFSEATRCLINVPVSKNSMDVDIHVPPLCPSALDAQETLLMSRLRSYLIFNETNPQWLDVTPLSPLTPPPQSQEVIDISMDGVDIRQEPSSLLTPSSTSAITAHPSIQQQPPPTLTSEQVIASLVFRYRYRSKGKSRPEAPLAGTEGVPVRTRKRSPLAAPEETP